MDKDYDTILKETLEKRLKRSASSDEIINADNDADLVNETLWQLINQMDIRLKKLENA